MLTEWEAGWRLAGRGADVLRKSAVHAGNEFPEPRLSALSKM